MLSTAHHGLPLYTAMGGGGGGDDCGGNPSERCGVLFLLLPQATLDETRTDGGNDLGPLEALT